MKETRDLTIRILIILILITALSGCNFPGQSEDGETNQGDQVLTAAAETVAAHMTEQVISSALTLQAEVANAGGEDEDQGEGEEGDDGGEADEPPTETPVVETTEPPPQDPTNTDTPEPSGPTATGVPCNKAAFVEDVTISDDTEIAPGGIFEKTWRLKNVGSCEWTSGYDLIYDHGDRMNAPDNVDFAGSVQPNQTVDLTVTLTAPTDGGTYRADFKLRSSDGIVFGIGNSGNSSFYVRIVVGDPTITPTETATNTPTPTSTATLVPKPDLQITGFVLDPATPIKGQPVHVTITVMNKGNAPSGQYHVEWWPGQNYASPACTFNVDNSNANGGRVLECDYAGYPSWYPSIVTVATVDPENVVDELDETNNVSTMEIEVQNP